jgi:hypothetical protein
MSGRIFISGLLLFAAIFGAAMWWFQTRGHYVEVDGIEVVDIAGSPVAVRAYKGVDADTSPLKLRGCFILVGEFAAPIAEDPTPLIAPDWFECFDAGKLDADLKSGAARPLLAEFNNPFGFDRVVAVYADGRAFQWRQINPCGAAHFSGDDLPANCPKPKE